MGKKANDISKSYRLSSSFPQESNSSGSSSTDLLQAAEMLARAGVRGVFFFVRGKFCFPRTRVSLRRKVDVS